MYFVADESVDAPIYKALRKAGHDVFAIVEHFPGIDDEQVLQIAYEKKSILITQDKDFGELVYRLGRAHFGIILLRLSGIGPDDKSKITVTIIGKYKDNLSESFSVVFPDYIKIRRPS